MKNMLIIQWIHFDAPLYEIYFVNSSIFHFADHIKLKQAILNLLKNSAEAESKYITITTKTENTGIQLIITDCGGGIPLALEDKVFELFTTSKEHGTGLGRVFH